jgi:hypothetical protein
MDDATLLALVKEERSRAIGFDSGSFDLATQRETALNYIRGEMPDVPALANRSRAVSTDVNDAIETVLPDLIQILAEDEDVVAFVPKGAEDEEAAAQETDYVKHVVFQLNPGFTVLETAIRDALQAKLGIIKWWREECKDEDRQEFEGKQPDELNAILQQRMSDGYELEADPVQAEDGTWSCVAVRNQEYSEVRIAPWPPEDFAVATDTVMLPDATYCAARSRPRKQDLIAQGIDRAKVDGLSPTASPVNNSTARPATR